MTALLFVRFLLDLLRVCWRTVYGEPPRSSAADYRRVLRAEKRSWR